MPIPMSELNKATRPIEERVVEFLSSQAGQAFTAWEIFAAVEGLEDKMAALLFLIATPSQREEALAPFKQALKRLLEQRKVKSGKHNLEDYYGWNSGD